MTNPEHEISNPLGLDEEPEQKDISDPDTPEWQKHTRH